MLASTRALLFASQSLLAGYLWDRSGQTAAFMMGAEFAILAWTAGVLMRR